MHWVKNEKMTEDTSKLINIRNNFIISRRAEAPGREILQRPRPSICLSAHPSVCLSVMFSFRTVTRKHIAVS